MKAEHALVVNRVKNPPTGGAKKMTQFRMGGGKSEREN